MHTSTAISDEGMASWLDQTMSYETPFFLFRRSKIRQNLREFEMYFPSSLIHYAMKANSEPEVLRVVANSGCGFEVASLYELNMLKEICVEPERIIYGSAVKLACHIKQFAQYGIDRFAFDSLPELEKIAVAAPRSRVFVRAKADDSGSVFQFSEKFGTSIETVVPLLHRAQELGLHPYGISFNVGSQARNPMAWAHSLKQLRPVFEELQSNKMAVDVLNLGGGYPCKYATDEPVASLSEIAKCTIAELNNFPFKPTLILEPGRRVVANTAVLVASVIERVERNGRTWLFLDAGIYNALFEALVYQGSTRYSVTSTRNYTCINETPFALAGPTGDGLDVITREVFLPHDTDAGDRVVIHDVGAYTLSLCSTFNGFPKPHVHFI